ncbi:hypothetical protein ACSR0Z_37540 [Streptomyces viridosporus]
MTKFSSADWKLNRTFRDGTWLCIQFNQAPGTPCAKIHRWTTRLNADRESRGRRDRDR